MKKKLTILAFLTATFLACFAYFGGFAFYFQQHQTSITQAEYNSIEAGEEASNLVYYYNGNRFSYIRKTHRGSTYQNFGILDDAGQVVRPLYYYVNSAEGVHGEPLNTHEIVEGFLHYPSNVIAGIDKYGNIFIDTSTLVADDNNNPVSGMIFKYNIHTSVTHITNYTDITTEGIAYRDAPEPWPSGLIFFPSSGDAPWFFSDYSRSPDQYVHPNEEKLSGHFTGITSLQGKVRARIHDLPEPKGGVIFLHVDTARGAHRLYLNSNTLVVLKKAGDKWLGASLDFEEHILSNDDVRRGIQRPEKKDWETRTTIEDFKAVNAPEVFSVWSNYNEHGDMIVTSRKTTDTTECFRYHELLSGQVYYYCGEREKEKEQTFTVVAGIDHRPSSMGIDLDRSGLLTIDTALAGAFDVDRHNPLTFTYFEFMPDLSKVRVVVEGAIINDRWQAESTGVQIPWKNVKHEGAEHTYELEFSEHSLGEPDFYLTAQGWGLPQLQPLQYALQGEFVNLASPNKDIEARIYDNGYKGVVYIKYKHPAMGAIELFLDYQNIVVFRKIDGVLHSASALLGSEIYFEGDLRLDQ